MSSVVASNGHAGAAATDAAPGAAFLAAQARLAAHDEARDAAALARNLRALRKRAGLTRAEAARLLDYDHTWLYAIESGRGQPSPRLLRQLAALYGVTPNDFYAETADECAC